MYSIMDRQREIALALRACPAAVAENAGVYALETSGYVKVRASHSSSFPFLRKYR